jgi:putative transposase
LRRTGPRARAARRAIYQAETVEVAHQWLEALEASWSKQYAEVGQMWRRVWEHITPMFALPPAVCKMIYPTNAVEALHRSLRKIINNWGGFPTDESAMKLPFLALKNVGLRWKRPVEWTAAFGQFSILFADRLQTSAR